MTIFDDLRAAPFRPHIGKRLKVLFGESGVMRGDLLAIDNDALIVNRRGSPPGQKTLAIPTNQVVYAEVWDTGERIIGWKPESALWNELAK